MGFVTGLERLLSKSEETPLSTGSPELDSLLGSGAPGVGWLMSIVPDTYLIKRFFDTSWGKAIVVAIFTVVLEIRAREGPRNGCLGREGYTQPGRRTT